MIIDLLTKKTWGPEFELFAKGVVSKNFTHFTANYYLKTCMARKARIQLDRRNLLFGGYLQPQTALDLQNFLIKMHYRCELIIDWGKDVLACF